jgi:hypothetical protein
MEEVRFLHKQADDCRTAAKNAGEDQARRDLLQLAERYDEEARRLNMVEIVER